MAHSICSRCDAAARRAPLGYAAPRMLSASWASCAPCNPSTQALARRLEEVLLAGAEDEMALAVALADAARSPTPGEQQAAVPAAAAAVAGGGAASGERGRSASQPSEMPSINSGSGSTELSLAMWRSSSQPSPAVEQAAAAAQQQQQQPPDSVTMAWQVLLVPLAVVARLDARPRVADAAAAVLLQALKLHGDALAPQQWLHLYQHVLQPLLALPADAAAAASAGHSLGEAGARRTSTGTGVWEGMPTVVPDALSFEGLDR